MRVTANRFWQLVRVVSVISLMSGVALAAGVAKPAAADPITITHGFLKNADSGDCIYVPNNSNLSGTKLEMSHCRTSPADTFEEWYSYSVGNGRYSINPANNTGLCMDIIGSSHITFTRVEQWTCTGGLNQQFYFQHWSTSPAGYYQLRVSHDGQCLDLEPSWRWPVQNNCRSNLDRYDSQNWIIINN
ncbi:MAG TPA: RICIN domain-containing protein [Candidatus Saccharimonadales bacterium]|nr:RICIN domain-containing protein [Candidatus Saccharimonadales bacterium]